MFPSCRRMLYKYVTVNAVRHRKRYPQSVEIMRENHAKTEEEDETFFPILSRLGITTKEKVHQLNVNCEDVLRMIYFGGIHKNMAMQYCHYLAHLSREGLEHDYFGEKCFELSTFILKNPQDLSSINVDNLLCDVATSSSRNCLSICDRIVNLNRLPGLKQKQIEILLDALYKFNMWDKANYLLQKVKPEQIGINLVELLTSRIIESTESYKNLKDEHEKNRLRNSIITHLIHVVEICFKNKLYFLTQYRDKFIKALTDLDLDITVNAMMKQSGRCVNCGDHLPLYDQMKTKALHSAIEDVLNKGSEKGLYYYTNPTELPRFKQYLAHINAVDKRPLSYVIDGLNVGYKNSTGFEFFTVQVTDEVKKTVKKHRPESKSQVLINTILRSNMISEKILVIGKHHMNRWPGLIDFFDKYKIHYFFSTDNSEDDLFQLYAATLKSSTFIVSNDQFRDVQSRDESIFKDNMREWLDTHQAIINNENLRAILPTPILKFPSVNKVTKTMHLPIADYTLNGMDAYAAPLAHNKKAMKWVCCRYGNVDVDMGSKTTTYTTT